jgi:hypothetical protein
MSSVLNIQFQVIMKYKDTHWHAEMRVTESNHIQVGCTEPYRRDGESDRTLHKKNVIITISAGQFVILKYYTVSVSKSWTLN